MIVTDTDAHSETSSPLQPLKLRYCGKAKTVSAQRRSFVCDLPGLVGEGEVIHGTTETIPWLIELLALSYLVHLSPVRGHLTEHVKDSDSVAGFKLPPNRSPCIVVNCNWITLVSATEDRTKGAIGSYRYLVTLAK